MTIIAKAKELIEEQGTEKAIQYFQNKIDEIGEAKDFPSVCKIAGFEIAIEFIKEQELKTN
jgi:hypothetical protein